MAGTRSSTRLRTGGEQPKESSKGHSRVRVASPKGARGARKTRSGTAAAEAETPSSSTPGQRDIPRRGARLADTRSIASIATSPVRDSDHYRTSEVDDDDDVDEDIVGQLDVERGESEESPFQHDTPDAEMMMKLRTNLYETAKQLYAHLRAGHRDRSWHSLLDVYRSMFNAPKAHFSTGNSLFLDRDPIEDALTRRSPEFPVDGPAIPHIISAANLVILMDSIQAAASELEARHLFQMIDEDFPRCIMAPESAIAKSYGEHQTFDRALEIRISLWILQIDAEKALTEEAAMELGSMLLFGISSGSVYPHQIDSKTIEFRPIEGVEFDEPDNEDDDQRKMRDDIFRDFKRVSEFMTDGEVDLNGLREAFPIDTYLDKLFKWAESLFGEVVKTIEHESARPTASPPEDAARPQDTVHGGYRGLGTLRGLAMAQGDRPAMVMDVGSRKRSRAGDVNGGDTYPGGTENGEEGGAPGPESKSLKRRVARTRPTPGTESTRSNDREDTEDVPPRGSHTAPVRASSPRRAESPPPPARMPQKRVRWDSHDEEMLKRLVAEHGCFWGYIEERTNSEGLFSSRRGQQQIRDKARNMKVSMLKGDKILPPKFDDVALASNHRMMVIKEGRNPDRLEADVDEHGQPVNTRCPEGVYE